MCLQYKATKEGVPMDGVEFMDECLWEHLGKQPVSGGYLIGS
jgi:hypothetical protein